MIDWLKKNIAVVLIGLISLTLFTLNYRQNTYLIGWDNLFPEFNFRLNIIRDITAVWQQYRGLGALDNFAHASNLVHDLVRFILSIPLPIPLIRWTFVFLMQFSGCVGMYVLLNKLINNKLSSLAGALFYSFNLAVIQQFYLPFEVFIIHFAALPWLFFSVLTYCESGKNKDLFIFAIVTLLSTSQAFVPTVFAVYFMGLIIVLTGKLIVSHKLYGKRAVLLLAVTIAINAFWIIPTTYSYLTYSKTVARAKNYQMASNDIFYRNKKFGDIASILLLKGSPLKFQQLDFKTNANHYMMWPWLNHINSPLFIIPSWIFIFLVLTGFWTAVSKKNRALLPFTLLFAFSFFMLATDTPLLGQLNQFIKKSIPLFEVIFRFTFTKFSIVFAFSYAIFIAFGIETLGNFLSHKIQRSYLSIAFIVILFLYTLPAFQGYFLYENLKVNLPEEYTQLMDFFNNQESSQRIAPLPIPWYWAWQQPKWGTINSGFMWYGIPQPMTELAFTPWGNKNESYYWELEQAIYSKNSELLSRVFNKYDISWIYLDKNIVLTDGKKMTIEMYENLLENTPGVESVGDINQIKLYRFYGSNSLDNRFTTLKSRLSNIQPSTTYDNFDSAYTTHGDYITTDSPPNFYYPYRSLFSNKSPSDIQFTVEETNDSIMFKAKLPRELTDYKVHIPNFSSDEFILYNNGRSTQYPISVSIDGVNLKDGDDLPDFQTGDFVASIPKSSINSGQLSALKPDECGVNPRGKVSIQQTERGIKLTSTDSHNCLGTYFPDLSHRYGYLITTNIEADQIRGLLFTITNETTDKLDIETYLDNDGKPHKYHFVIPPRDYYGMGYSFKFDNISEGKEIISNSIGDFTVNQIPYYFLKNLYLHKPFPLNNIFYLSQSFHPGWKAYSVTPCNANRVTCNVKNAVNNMFPFLFGTELKEHVVVNNWANGWMLDNVQRSTLNVIENRAETYNVESLKLNVILVFWPQYLEFIGFGLMIVAFLCILKVRQN